jgi:hypothetical protein
MDSYFYFLYHGFFTRLHGIIKPPAVPKTINYFLNLLGFLWLSVALRGAFLYLALAPLGLRHIPET